MALYKQIDLTRLDHCWFNLEYHFSVFSSESSLVISTVFCLFPNLLFLLRFRCHSLQAAPRPQSHLSLQPLHHLPLAFSIDLSASAAGFITSSWFTIKIPLFIYCPLFQCCTFGPFLRSRLESASFCIKQNPFVVIQPSLFMTTACWHPGNHKLLILGSSGNLLKLQPSFWLCKLANCKVYGSGDYANVNASPP